MVVALQVAGPAPRRWFRRRKASAQMEKIRVGDGMYYLITAGRTKRGRLPWEEIRRLAGRGAGRMLLPGGLEVPEEAGIKPFCGELLGQEMMAITAVHLLRVGRPRRGAPWRRFTIRGDGCRSWPPPCCLIRRTYGW